jgi:sugar lactone lactonase YvrE
VPEPQVLLAGLAIGESPRWHEDRLWFSNWVAQEIVAVDLEGESEVMARVPTAGPFCIDWLPDGRLLVVAGQEAQLLRGNPDGSLSAHAEMGSISERPWNDIVVDGRGNAYVGNIGFDFPEGEFVPGILALVAPDGSARQVADEIAFPNGIVVTPDNSTLILAESYGNRLTAFDIAADGGLSNRRVWAELGDGVPDGICLDAEGAVWYGDVPNERCVRVREGGEVLQTVELDRGCFACMLGGENGRTLFMVAADMTSEARTGQVLEVGAPTAGAGWP